jgi:hypothetical protein
MEVLYSSQMIQKAIQRLFGKVHPSDRRVALVAYIGKDHATYLPNPKGIHIICNPTPGATSAIAVSELQRAGANVQFSDRLHMKVYWSKKNGCVISSANLSRNAFGIKGLKEAGILVEQGQVEINKLIKAAKPYDANKGLKKLKQEEEKIERGLASVGRRWSNNIFDYADWYKLQPQVQETWKLGWWETTSVPAEAGKDLVKIQYNRANPVDFLNVTKKQAREGDWFLRFLIRNNETDLARHLSWMYVHHVVPMRNNEPAYERDFPHQAIQALPKRLCREPPFKITPAFCIAFKKAAKRYGLEKIINNPDLVPSNKLLKLINDEVMKRP